MNLFGVHINHCPCHLNLKLLIVFSRLTPVALPGPGVPQSETCPGWELKLSLVPSEATPTPTATAQATTTQTAPTRTNTAPSDLGYEPKLPLVPGELLQQKAILEGRHLHLGHIG